MKGEYELHMEINNVIILICNKKENGNVKGIVDISEKCKIL